MEFNQVNKVAQQDLFNIVKLQIVTHCSMNDIYLNETELKCLTILGCNGRIHLQKFSELIVDLKIMGSVASVHNCLMRIIRSNLFIKEGGGKKYIYLNPNIGVQAEGNKILNYKFVYVAETNPLDIVDTTNSSAVKSA